MEFSSLETSRDSVLAKGVESSGSTSLHPAYDRRAASDVAFGSPTEERCLQTGTKQPSSKRERLNSPEESSSKGKDSTCLSFLKKLWDVVENDRFESVWWEDNGKCVAIHEELFEEEVLARRGRLRIFESESMRSFTRDLHLYGFTRKPCHFSKSGSRNDLLVEEAAREFHYFYNPNFTRHFPYLLMKYKQSFCPEGFSPDMDLHALCQKRKSDVELVWDTTSKEESGAFTTGPRENMRISAPRTATPAKRRAKAATRVRCAPIHASTTALTNSDPAVGREQLNPLVRSFSLQHSSLGLAGIQGAASAATSPGCAMLAMPNSHLTPELVSPTSPAMLAATTALSVPRSPQGQTPLYPYCPTPTCSPKSGPTLQANGLEPQPGEC